MTNKLKFQIVYLKLIDLILELQKTTDNFPGLENLKFEIKDFPNKMPLNVINHIEQIQARRRIWTISII